MRETVLTFAAALALTFLQNAPADDNEGATALARHKTVARYMGTRQVDCSGRSALCPKRCGHSGSYTFFNISKYLEYLRPDPQGEAKKQNVSFKLDGSRKAAGLTEDTLALLKEMKQKDYVLLVWTHGRLTRNGVSLPQHTILEVKKLSEEEAAKLLAN